MSSSPHDLSEKRRSIVCNSGDHCGRGISSAIAAASVADEGLPPRLPERRSSAVHAPTRSGSAGSIPSCEQFRTGKGRGMALLSRPPGHAKDGNSATLNRMPPRPASDVADDTARVDGTVLELSFRLRNPVSHRSSRRPSDHIRMRMKLRIARRFRFRALTSHSRKPN